MRRGIEDVLRFLIVEFGIDAVAQATDSSPLSRSLAGRELADQGPSLVRPPMT
jgi:hypothetical protein